MWKTKVKVIELDQISYMINPYPEIAIGHDLVVWLLDDKDLASGNNFIVIAIIILLIDLQRFMAATLILNYAHYSGHLQWRGDGSKEDVRPSMVRFQLQVVEVDLSQGVQGCDRRRIDGGNKRRMHSDRNMLLILLMLSLWTQGVFTAGHVAKNHLLLGWLVHRALSFPTRC